LGTTVDTVDELAALVGQQLGTSEWREITQDRVNLFADATDDHQWIHVDPDRAAGGPFGGPIAHGYLTLSLLVPMWAEVLTVRNRSMAVNYGLNKVRFPAPVPVGSRIRLVATLASCEQVAGGVQIVVDAVVEAEGSDRPVCVAHPIYRIYA
jgi:acyl dehydratase